MEKENNSSKKKSKKITDPKYIAYLERGDSAAILIVKNYVESLNTKGKWIDILESDGDRNKHGIWDFKEFSIELFRRRIKPDYSGCKTEEQIKYRTWAAADADIRRQRENGVKGPKFRIKVKLFNKNKNKYHFVTKCFNKSFGRYVPMQWKTSSCELRKIRVPDPADWQYEILSVKRI